MRISDGSSDSCSSDLPKTRSIHARDRNQDAVERGTERDLAREARRLVAVLRAVEKIILVVAHWRQFVGEGRIDMDVAGRAGATAAAKRKQLVEAVVAEHLHQRAAVLALQSVCGPLSTDRNGSASHRASGWKDE